MNWKKRGMNRLNNIIEASPKNAHKEETRQKQPLYWPRLLTYAMSVALILLGGGIITGAVLSRHLNGSATDNGTAPANTEGTETPTAASSLIQVRSVSYFDDRFVFDVDFLEHDVLMSLPLEATDEEGEVLARLDTQLFLGQVSYLVIDAGYQVTAEENVTMTFDYIGAAPAQGTKITIENFPAIGERYSFLKGQ